MPSSARVDALLLLGGNIGDRRAALRRALKGLAALPRTRLIAVSSLYETAPVGPSKRPFYNCAAKLRTALSPMGLLVECKRLEAEAGRRPGPRWGPRPLDVDILDYGGRRVRTPWLVLPHPRAAGRAFALAPARELSAGWKPDGRSRAGALLRALKPDLETVKIVSHGV